MDRAAHEVAVSPRELSTASRGMTAARAEVAGRPRGGTIWIDLDNSPHVPFFAPIFTELEKAGYTVFVTARDCSQTCGLADLMGLKYRRIGRHYGKRRLWKLGGLCWRAMQLLPSVVKAGPMLAVSHGSRSQLVVANALRIPSITIADYEFAKLWFLVRPTWLMTPVAIGNEALRECRSEVLKYPGIKEDAYVPGFQPTAGMLTSFGISDEQVVVLLRPPASEAHYHCPESDDLFEGVVEYLEQRPEVSVIVLPRNERQADEIRCKWKGMLARGKMVIPSQVVDGLNLIWHADVVISGGGTMNREAAALGVPVYSIFRGRIGAVDRYLASCGRLVLIEKRAELADKLKLRKRDTSSMQEASPGTLAAIVNHISAAASGNLRRAQ